MYSRSQPSGLGVQRPERSVPPHWSLAKSQKESGGQGADVTPPHLPADPPDAPTPELEGALQESGQHGLPPAPSPVVVVDADADAEEVVDVEAAPPWPPPNTFESTVVPQAAWTRTAVKAIEATLSERCIPELQLGAVI